MSSVRAPWAARSCAKFDAMVDLPSLGRTETTPITFGPDWLISRSQAMRQFLKNPGEEFDYIVVDLPPMAPVADARAFASQLDGTLLVVGWGQAARGLIRTTLADEPEITSKNLGVVLNNVDMKQLKLYSEPGSYDYFYRNSYYKG